MKKKILITIPAIILLCVLLYNYFIVSISKYVDTHTWATIRVSGEVNTDILMPCEFDQECLQGDTVSIDNVILLVTDITHEGEISFEVKQGNLMDSDGNPIDKVTLTKEKEKEFRIDNGSLSMVVVSNRYQ